MNLADAIRLFDITDINKINDKELQVKYRRLAKVYHPDVSKDKSISMTYVNEAYDFLKEHLTAAKIIKEISGAKNSVILSANDIYMIYSKDKSVDYVIDNKCVVINSETINRYNVFVDINFTIYFNSVEVPVNIVRERNYKDIYDFNYTYKCKSLKEPINVIIATGYKNIQVNWDGQSLVINAVINPYIKVRLDIERQLVVDGKQ